MGGLRQVKEQNFHTIPTRDDSNLHKGLSYNSVVERFDGCGFEGRKRCEVRRKLFVKIKEK